MSEDNPDKQAARARGADGKFLPSVSGNPKGRPPRAHCLSDAIYELLAGEPDVVIKKWQKGKLTGARRAAIAWFKKINMADMTALKEALERVEGKVAQKIEATGKDGESLKPTTNIFNVTSPEAENRIKKLLAGEKPVDNNTNH